jgi:serine/threonine protein kinase
VSDELNQGDLLGDYEIVSAAGLGGMGIVYKAMQRSLQRVVALKVIREEIARTPEYRERFLREARLAASVDHPNVVRVYDVSDGDGGGQLFLAMQWVDGEDLSDVLADAGRLAPERAVAIATQLAGALEAVHSVSGLIHRDVKPSNVLLAQVAGRDHAYLTDFGIARPAETANQLTKTGWIVGTTGYLAPEQIRGGELDQRSDLYALGCLFFETLTGRAPFVADNEMALRWAHANDPRPTASAALPTLGKRYDGFLSKALAIDPDERFASGREFAEALASAHAGESEIVVTKASHAATAVGPPTPMPPPPPTPQPAPGAYPTYAYSTPPPVPAQQGRSGNPTALIVLAVVAVAGIAAGALAAAGAFSGAKTKTIDAATAASAAVSHPARAQQSPVGTSSCGGDLSVGPDTSCPFAKNVEQAYAQSAGGENEVTAYSPTTGISYVMKCTGGSPHVCTGGKGATVYFTSGPGSASSSQSSTPAASSSTPAAPASSSSASSAQASRRCDQNVSANSQTSCPFAKNTFTSYWRGYKANGVQQDTTVSAYSPTTHRQYEMNCAMEAGTVDCSGGNDAFVTFPMQAVEDYAGP